MVRVHVTDVLGRPLAGATVLALWNRDYIRPPTDSDRTSGTTYRMPTDPPLVALRLATDGNGEVRARIPADRYLVVSAQAGNSTEEWTPLLDPGAHPSDLGLRTWPSSSTVRVGLTIPENTVAGPTLERWFGARVAFPEAQAGPEFLDRASLMQATMEWNTSMAQPVSAYAGFRDGDSGWIRGGGGGDPSPGPHKATAWVRLGDGRSWLRSPNLQAGVQAVDGAVLLAPVEVAGTVTVTLDHRAVAAPECGVMAQASPIESYDPINPAHNPTVVQGGHTSPGLGVAWVLGIALLIPAFAWRRSRR